MTKKKLKKSTIQKLPVSVINIRHHLVDVLRIYNRVNQRRNNQKVAYETQKSSCESALTVRVQNGVPPANRFSADAGTIVPQQPAEFSGRKPEEQ